jgi:hypothetical protein
VTVAEFERLHGDAVTLTFNVARLQDEPEHDGEWPRAATWSDYARSAEEAGR